MAQILLRLAVNVQRKPDRAGDVRSTCDSTWHRRPCHPRARTERKPETLSRSQAMSKPALIRETAAWPLRETTCAASSKQRVAGSNPVGRTSSDAIFRLFIRYLEAKQGANGVPWKPSPKPPAGAVGTLGTRSTGTSPRTGLPTRSAWVWRSNRSCFQRHDRCTATARTRSTRPRSSSAPSLAA